MANNAIETVMGAVVLAVAGGFLYFAYNNSNVKPIEGYAVTAAFSNISGVNAGTSVRVGGIKIGVVEALDLDPTSYQAIAKLRVGSNIKLPKDSTAAVLSSGLIGEKFIGIEPGGEEAMLGDGDRITLTQSSVSLEEMIGKFVFSGGGADKPAGEAKSNAGQAAPHHALPSEPAASPFGDDMKLE
jgi:phospholipid/cholesterol/gamma-HCH transport system substrate-binding protein